MGKTANFAELHSSIGNCLAKDNLLFLAEPIVNLTEPVELVFEIEETKKKLVAAYWDFGANGEYFRGLYTYCLYKHGIIHCVIILTHIAYIANGLSQ